MNYISCAVFSAKVVKIILQVIGICLIFFCPCTSTIYLRTSNSAAFCMPTMPKFSAKLPAQLTAWRCRGTSPSCARGPPAGVSLLTPQNVGVFDVSRTAKILCRPAPICRSMLRGRQRFYVTSRRIFAVRVEYLERTTPGSETMMTRIPKAAQLLFTFKDFCVSVPRSYFLIIDTS